MLPRFSASLTRLGARGGTNRVFTSSVVMRKQALPAILDMMDAIQVMPSPAAAPVEVKATHGGVQWQLDQARRVWNLIADSDTPTFNVTHVSTERIVRNGVPMWHDRAAGAWRTSPPPALHAGVAWQEDQARGVWKMIDRSDTPTFSVKKDAPGLITRNGIQMWHDEARGVWRLVEAA